MEIPVGVRSSAAVTQRGTFSCPRCKHWQRAEVVGNAGGAATLFGGGELAHERARVNASKDAARTLRFATCPRCKQRSGHAAFIGFYALVALVVVAVTCAFAFLAPLAMHDTDDSSRATFHLWFPLCAFAIMMIAMPITIIAKWRSTDRRVRWLEF